METPLPCIHSDKDRNSVESNWPWMVKQQSLRSCTKLTAEAVIGIGGRTRGAGEQLPPPFEKWGGGHCPPKTKPSDITNQQVYLFSWQIYQDAVKSSQPQESIILHVFHCFSALGSSSIHDWPLNFNKVGVSLKFSHALHTHMVTLCPPSPQKIELPSATYDRYLDSKTHAKDSQCHLKFNEESSSRCYTTWSWS